MFSLVSNHRIITFYFNETSYCCLTRVHADVFSSPTKRNYMYIYV